MGRECRRERQLCVGLEEGRGTGSGVKTEIQFSLPNKVNWPPQTNLKTYGLSSQVLNMSAFESLIVAKTVRISS